MQDYLGKLLQAINLVALAIRLVWKAASALTLGILSLTAAQALLSPIELVLSRMIIDRAALDLGLASTPDKLTASFPLVVWILLAAAVLAVGQLIQPFSFTFQSLAGDRLTGYVTGEIIRAANKWPGIGRFEDSRFVDDLKRARVRAVKGGLEVLTYTAQGVLAVFGIIMAALLLIGLNPLVPLSIVLATLPSMTRYWEYGMRTYGHLYTQTGEARRLEYSRDVLFRPESAKDVRLYGLGRFFANRYEDAYANTVRALERLRFRVLGSMLLTGALSACVVGGAYVYMVVLVTRGEHTVGDLVLYGGAVMLLVQYLLNFSGDLGNISESLGFLPSLFRVLDAPPDLPTPKQPIRVRGPFQRGITFEDVSFTYPGTEQPVLDRISFSVSPGECLALVGHNGAGKTTIVKLLLRMYDPTHGHITMEGIDIREYDLVGLRSQMGVIFQDFVRYELTAAENIAMGQIDRLDDEELLMRAAAKGGASELVERLPEGLGTHLGREFGGRELSGGEWQKLALSRAFIRDSQLLVLDEPTASLDVQTEYEVYTRFRDLARENMTLLISHRLSTVLIADRILYLEGGRIREEGSHEYLMDKGGEYARLYKLQASQYLRGEDEEATE